MVDAVETREKTRANWGSSAAADSFPATYLASNTVGEGAKHAGKRIPRVDNARLKFSDVPREPQVGERINLTFRLVGVATPA